MKFSKDRIICPQLYPVLVLCNLLYARSCKEYCNVSIEMKLKLNLCFYLSLTQFVHIIKRTLHAGLKRRILFSCVKNDILEFNSWLRKSVQYKPSFYLKNYTFFVLAKVSVLPHRHFLSIDRNKTWLWWIVFSRSSAHFVMPIRTWIVFSALWDIYFHPLHWELRHS